MELFYSPRKMGTLLSTDKNLRRDEVVEEEQNQSE
jgi:hypothetical protein